MKTTNELLQSLPATILNHILTITKQEDGLAVMYRNKFSPMVVLEYVKRQKLHDALDAMYRWLKRKDLITER